MIIENCLDFIAVLFKLYIYATRMNISYYSVLRVLKIILYVVKPQVKYTIMFIFFTLLLISVLKLD